MEPQSGEIEKVDKMYNFKDQKTEKHSKVKKNK